MELINKVTDLIFKANVGRIPEELIIRTLYCNNEFLDKLHAEISGYYPEWINKKNLNINKMVLMNGINIKIEVDESFDFPVILIDHYRIGEYD